MGRARRGEGAARGVGAMMVFVRVDAPLVTSLTTTPKARQAAALASVAGTEAAEVVGCVRVAGNGTAKVGPREEVRPGR